MAPNLIFQGTLMTGFRENNKKKCATEARSVERSVPGTMTYIKQITDALQKGR